MSFSPDAPIVWTELPVRNLKDAMAFYSKVFQYPLKVDETGPQPIAMLPGNGTAGHLYEGAPSSAGSGPTVHMMVPDAVETALERVWTAGGSVPDIPIVTIPSGRFAYALDPDGNSIGLFEPTAA